MESKAAVRPAPGRCARVLLAALVGVVVVAADVTAARAAEPGVRNPRQNARQHRQDLRIRQGVRSGELTRDEAKTLLEERREIRQEERAYKSDGSYTAAERAEVRGDLNRLSRDIYREKHDGEKRPGAE